MNWQGGDEAFKMTYEAAIGPVVQKMPAGRRSQVFRLALTFGAGVASAGISVAVPKREVRRVFGTAHFDLLIAFSPVTTVAAQLLWCIRRFRPRSYFVLWDFFPFHQRSIGLLPGGGFAVAR